MANIHIKELFGSDNITDLTEKVNFNFDQLILAGGGPEGPVGEVGASGPAGPAGVRGSQWIGASGGAGVTAPTDGVFRENDFKLISDGDVEYYDGSAFVTTGINLRGPKGDVGGAGDGSISILPGKTETYGDQSAFVPTILELGPFITGANADDKDDYKKGSGQPFINAGIDFIGIGRGNNSLVLGRYATLFDTGAGGTAFTPPGAPNGVMEDFPQLEANVPMLLVSQNDYKDPATASNTYENGISIGLTKSHPNTSYTDGSGFQGNRMSYANNANISIENKFFDLKISSSKMLTLSSQSNTSTFRLGQTIARGSSINGYSTRLVSEIYTNFKINDSFFIDLSDSLDNTSGKELITRAESTYIENTKVYTSNGDYRENISKSFIANNDYGSKDANEIVLINRDIARNDSSSDKRIIGYAPFKDSIELDSNFQGFGFRIGQTVVNPGRMKEGVTLETTGIPTVEESKRIHINYQGFGYDQAFIQYSGLDTRFDSSISNINNDTNTSYGGVYATIPNIGALQTALGYNIFDPLFNVANQKGSRSMVRMGIYPGFFRKAKDDSNNFTGESDARQNKFFDVAHRMMPTGSLDVFGTVRIREQETTDAGAKDGWVAVNKKDGILGFENPNVLGVGTPTFSIIMFPEMASNKFSFFTQSTSNFGREYTAGLQPYDFGTGTTSGRFSSFPGKGSNELKDYYICNGAVLADSRDILVTGPFSKMEGMNIIARNSDSSKQVVKNGQRADTNFPFLYEVNNDFISVDGATTNESLGLKHTGRDISIGQFYSEIMNGTSSFIPGKVFNSAGSLFSTGEKVNYKLNRWAAAWGYSILAGEKLESGFRVVLPNYFGRVAKMQFPNSTSIVRAISGEKLDKEFSTDTKDSGYIYYQTGNSIVYNKQWMMKSMFDSGGFPYINGLQMPRNVVATANHNHDSGTYRIMAPSQAVPDFPTSTQKLAWINDKKANSDFGGHFHNHRWSAGVPAKSSGGIDKKSGSGKVADDVATTLTIDFGGGHGHETETFTGNSGNAGAKVYFSTSKSWIDGAGRDYDDTKNDLENYDDTGFKISQYFAYDDTNQPAKYDDFSNWLNYNTNSSSPDEGGQKFISPPFKGTIMAINLKGLKNPNRGNSLITDLHFVGGIPQCSIDAGTGENDMSWFSELQRKNPASPTTYNTTTTTDFIHDILDKNNAFPGDKSVYDNIVIFAGQPYLRAFEYGFKQMARNDDTMHPETFVNTGASPGHTSTLDYKAEFTKGGPFERRKWDLYHSGLTRGSDFNT